MQTDRLNPSEVTTRPSEIRSEANTVWLPNSSLVAMKTDGLAIELVSYPALSLPRVIVSGADAKVVPTLVPYGSLGHGAATVGSLWEQGWSEKQTFIILPDIAMVYQLVCTD
jgi:hypothetical protein